jgi:hypothetical protein
MLMSMILFIYVLLLLPMSFPRLLLPASRYLLDLPTRVSWKVVLASS